VSLNKITDIDGLHRHIYAAMQLEHATIPVYLTALYSIKPGTNADAAHILRVVAVEEMLHLTLAGNLMNAVGGKVDMTQPGFVPPFPTALPDGELDFTVDCQGFSRQAVETFLRIERPAELDDGIERTLSREAHHSALSASRPDKDAAPEEHFFSIGQFYKAIEEGLHFLHNKMGDSLFSGDPSYQISNEYYYSGGGKLIEITDMETAMQALNLIAEQGEGITSQVFDSDGEISHYFRFHQLIAGRYYKLGDQINQPTGGRFEVDWEAVFPTKTNARLSDFEEGTDLHEQAVRFNYAYFDFLELLSNSFNGNPETFTEAVGGMFKLKELFYQLMRQKISEEGNLNAAPTFEIDAVTKGGTQ
jgi:hypothetical protein